MGAWLLYNYIMSQDSPRPSVVSISPDIMSGTPVFAGTRVPVQTLIDYLEAGDSIDEFLVGFPTVGREQVMAFVDNYLGRCPRLI